MTEDTAARLDQIRESFTADDVDWLLGEVRRLSIESAAYRESYDDAATSLGEVTDDAGVVLARLTRVQAERDRIAAERDTYQRAHHEARVHRDQLAAELEAERSRAAAVACSLRDARNGMQAEVDRLAARIAAALRDHEFDPTEPGNWCDCGLAYPCPTRRALEGEQQ